MTMPVSSSSAWVRSIVGLFESQGVAPGWLFEQAGLDLSRLKHSHERFEFAEITKLWQLAVARTGQEALGLDRHLARRHINFDFATQAMWPNADLGTALGGFSRYLLLINDSAAFTMEPQRSDAWLMLAHGTTGDSPRQRVEFGMLALLLLCQRVTHRPLRPLAMEFVFPEPADFHPHRMAFQCPLRFGQASNRMLLGQGELQLHVAVSGASLFAVRERVIEERLGRFANARTSYRASEEIVRRLHLGEPRREEVARSLGLADAALEQRLRAEGNPFDELLDGVRKELAEHYFAQRDYMFGPTASLLGWDTPAPLTAACKRWFGLAPAQYRQLRMADTVAS